jgi:hypothetical protein
MSNSDVVSAEFVALPRKESGLFPGRPWVVYFEGGRRRDGKGIKRGLHSFRLKREAAAFAFAICPTANADDVPF